MSQGASLGAEIFLFDMKESLTGLYKHPIEGLNNGVMGFLFGTVKGVAGNLYLFFLIFRTAFKTICWNLRSFLKMSLRRFYYLD